ncbi:MAG: GDP-L-fucose synthase [Candidatus Omnitrophica bacterium]|nr:GDP-L-fucose synthase [Candidatus Omnitrophota bacterium]
MDKNAKIYIAGHTGMVGKAVCQLLRERGYRNLLLKSEAELDLREQDKTEKLFQEQRPDYVLLFAAKVGGIKANINYPADFLYDNIMIEANIIQRSYKYKVKKLLYLGSSCIYPRNCPQPMKEECLLSGELEPTNEGYALAKIVGLKLCQYYNQQFATNFICLIPCNLYGINDNFDLDSSHVIPALIRKFHEGKINQKPDVTVWGSGKARREFLFVDDLADACLYFMDCYNGKEVINVGPGEDIPMSELVFLIKDIVGYRGRVVFDSTQPEGMPRKLLDVGRLKRLGWKPKTKLEDGIKITYEWYCRAYG